MSKADIQSLRVLYCNLMKEVKDRHHLVADLLSRKHDIPAVDIYEFTYLQLRMICELIALGCLAAHGDILISQAGRLRQLWKPSEILEKLEKLHPQFYPVPADEQVDGGYLVGVVEDPTIDHLTKPDLLKLYSECGNVLHRGSIKNLHRRGVLVSDFDRVTEWADKCRGLLNRHVIHLRDPRKKLYVMMQTKSDKDRVLAIELTLNAYRQTER